SIPASPDALEHVHHKLRADHESDQTHEAREHQHDPEGDNWPLPFDARRAGHHNEPNQGTREKGQEGAHKRCHEPVADTNLFILAFFLAGHWNCSLLFLRWGTTGMSGCYCPHTFRCRDEAMLSILRYLVTVRRATG